MAQGYSDITRESDPYALPDCETFYVSQLKGGERMQRFNDYLNSPDCETFYVSQLEVNYNLENLDHADEYTLTEAGWYWWSCFPGCLPDGPANGPFNTEEEATTDAQDIG